MRSFLILISLFLLGCKVAPEPIDYGSDACHYCSMTIVDRQHAAQFVTKKGKSFKFDAAECMMNHLQEVTSNKVSLFLVNDYNSPEELIDATKATYLISKEIPSPMGEFLSAFRDKEKAEALKIKHGGELLEWDDLQSKFERQ